MARTKSVFKLEVPKVDFIDNGEAVMADRLDEVMKLKVGMRIKVLVPKRETSNKDDESKIVYRTIEKIYKHHVLCVAPNGYKQCFTKGEVFIRNFRKGGKGYKGLS